VTAEGWTIPQACEQFAEQGMPVDEARFRIAVIRGLRIRRTGEMRKPKGSEGGRGQLLYDIGQLQRLHAWYLEGCQITKQDP
jgi:hypothetical protein